MSDNLITAIQQGKRFETAPPQYVKANMTGPDMYYLDPIELPGVVLRQLAQDFVNGANERQLSDREISQHLDGLEGVLVVLNYKMEATAEGIKAVKAGQKEVSRACERVECGIQEVRRDQQKLREQSLVLQAQLNEMEENLSSLRYRLISPSDILDAIVRAIGRVSSIALAAGSTVMVQMRKLPNRICQLRISLFRNGPETPISTAANKEAEKKLAATKYRSHQVALGVMALSLVLFASVWWAWHCVQGTRELALHLPANANQS